jgi:tetratricopeptide (TPR) repeat protein
MIVSTTLTASNADIIGEALASVIAHVDRCLVIDTGARDDTLEVARRVAGEKLLVRELSWRDDFAAARNFALEAATAAGAEWAVTVDTDERLVFEAGFDLRAALAETPANVLLVGYSDGSYAKERIVRLPTAMRWQGPTHEALGGQRPGDPALLEGLHFRELPKDEAALRRKFERDVTMLRRHLKTHSREPRWHYYLGASHQDLGQWAAAIEAFKACAALGGWAEEGAWACYRAAECCCRQQRWKEAIDFCARGLAIRPATAELAWLAGYAAYHAGRHEDAIAWSNMAIVNGLYQGAGASYPRISFSHPPALWEGPYDVLRSVFKALGNGEAAAEAEQEYENARQARLQPSEARTAAGGDDPEKETPP